MTINRNRAGSSKQNRLSLIGRFVFRSLSSISPTLDGAAQAASGFPILPDDR